MKPKELNAFFEANKDKIRKYADDGIRHVQSERERKRLIPKKILQLAKEGEIKVHTLWKNMQLDRALFVTDELEVALATDQGILAQELTDNANRVLKYETTNDDFRELKDIIVCENAIYGISATVIESFDDDEIKPIIDTIDPLSIIPDPKNWRGSKMRFIGLEKAVTIDYIKNNKSFDKVNREKVIAYLSEEWKKNERSRNTANRTEDIPDDELATIVLFFSVWNGVKYMSVWANDYQYCLKVVELGPLTKAEKLNPSKVKFPVHLHRAKPIIGSFFGASLADELLPIQRVQSELANLQLIGARKDELGDDYLIDNRIGLDASILSKTPPGGRFIDADFSQVGATQNPFIQVPKGTSGVKGVNMMQFLDQLGQEVSGNMDIAFGQSPTGQQTKGEIQTMQQNANNILNWVGSNLLDGMKELILDMYKAYVLYMPEKAVKVISGFDKGTQYSLSLKKREFAADGKVSLAIISKSQKAIQDEKDFGRLSVSVNMLLPNIKSKYHINKLLRLTLNKSGIQNINAIEYIPETPEEITATQNLLLLNDNRDVALPIPGEDLNTYRDIYSQAMPTDAKRKALEEIDRLILETRGSELTQGVGNSQAVSMGMNQISNQSQATMPTTNDVKL